MEKSKGVMPPPEYRNLPNNPTDPKERTERQPQEGDIRKATGAGTDANDDEAAPQNNPAREPEANR